MCDDFESIWFYLNSSIIFFILGTEVYFFHYTHNNCLSKSKKKIC